VLCFGVQTALVYFDPSRVAPLGPEAAAGRRIWQRNNCQSCHQIYGFGGFLGPDLTNAASRLAPQRFVRLLAEGSGRMPAFDLSVEEAAAVMAFLWAMDETGQGQAKVVLHDANREDPALRLTRAIRAELTETGNASAREGFDLFIARDCRTCHLPQDGFAATAPDLLSVGYRLDRLQVAQILEHGLPPMMSPPDLSESERRAMHKFLDWLASREYAVRRRSRPQENENDLLAGAPWWEFR
jgi:mono/diheme cytochrome c family protein